MDVDLVFYNRLLKCYVLIDLKIGNLTHQYLGQMQMYVNYFDRYVKTEKESPTVGFEASRQVGTVPSSHKPIFTEAIHKSSNFL